MDGFFYIGKFSELSYVSPPGRNALRRNGMMSLKRPAAGGESRERDSFLLYEHDKVYKQLWHQINLSEDYYSRLPIKQRMSGQCMVLIGIP